MWIFVLCSVFALGACSSELLREFSKGNRDFSAAVYQEITKEEGGSFLSCPISVEMVMGLAGLGSKGDTWRQISRGLRLPENQETTESIFEHVAPQLRGNDFYALTSANKIYAMEGFRINKTYQQLARSVFGAEVETVDFSRNIDSARNINTWVERQTNNKIHNLVKPDDLSASTRMVLINAMHFKGKWRKPFDVYDTTKRKFYLNNEESRLIDMMHITDTFNYYENKELDCKFLEMPYEGGDVTMVIVLPNKKDGLKALEYYSNLLFQPQPFAKQHVRVEIPKFSMETTITFKPILERLGMTTPFAAGADFSGMVTEGNNLYIDKVIQKTFINVTEKGTEAAAATAVPLLERIGEGHIFIAEPFFANRPFMFYMLCKDVVIFSGRFTKPDQPAIP